MNTHFVCKFCGHQFSTSNMSTGHTNMCKKCYSDILRYKRAKSGQVMLDETFTSRFEKICKSNKAAGRYYPSCYEETKVVKVTCKCCSIRDAIPYPSNPTLCKDCGATEARYRAYLSKLKKLCSSDRNCTDEIIAMNRLIDNMELMYKKRYDAGNYVPNVYKRRHGLN